MEKPKWFREGKVLGNELWDLGVEPHHPWWVAWTAYAAKFLGFCALIVIGFTLVAQAYKSDDSTGFLIAWAGLGIAIFGASMMADTALHAISVFGSFRVAQKAAVVVARWSKRASFPTEALEREYIATVNREFNPDACTTPDE